MRKIFLHTLPIILCAVAIAPARANWQYPGEYIGEGWYEDNGSRFVISVRGGASFARADIENKIGTITPGYYADENGNVGYCTSADCPGYIGYGDWSTLPAKDNFSTFGFTAGASIGFTMPYRPQWRMELGWDHIAEMDYNASPLFQGGLELNSGIVLDEEVGAVQSTVSTDIIGAMLFYDFYTGLIKPTGTLIPYVGLGAGYGHTKTVMNLFDPFGNLSMEADMQNFGEPSTVDGLLNFYRSETETGNFALMGALGVSYGITERMFLDFGARFTYLPRITWALTNADDTRKRDVFQAKNMIYSNVTLGLRFEF